ncbi:MAG: hypothetical protein MZV70_29880 [Desulfobacterales bacterium]|nr:hypothetical protein [Desulfobacterales bacterium]
MAEHFRRYSRPRVHHGDRDRGADGGRAHGPQDAKTRRSWWSTTAADSPSACSPGTSAARTGWRNRWPPPSAPSRSSPPPPMSTRSRPSTSWRVELGLAIENPQAIKTVNMALLTGAAVEVHDPLGCLAGRIPNARGLRPRRAARRPGLGG